MFLIRGWFVFLFVIIKQVDDVLFPTIVRPEFDQQIVVVECRFVLMQLIKQFPIYIFYLASRIEIEARCGVTLGYHVSMCAFECETDGIDVLINQLAIFVLEQLALFVSGLVPDSSLALSQMTLTPNRLRRSQM